MRTRLLEVRQGRAMQAGAAAGAVMLVRAAWLSSGEWGYCEGQRLLWGNATRAVLSQPNIVWVSTLAVGRFCADDHAIPQAHVL